LLLVGLAHGGTAGAATFRVAVAANFKGTLEKLAPSFEAATGNSIEVIPASTGTLYAQIVSGAPFDVFLAADSERPRKLEQSGYAVPGSRFTYAIGRLVLLAPGKDPDAGYLSRHAGRIAIANPSTAPYGQAAMEVLKALGADSWSLVVGTNVLQAFQFVDTGSVAAGLVALSHVRNNPSLTASDYWIIPQHYYTPIRQQGILLKTGNPDAMQLINFLRSKDAVRIIVDDGYAVVAGE